jgi:hypothetical protein
MNLPDSKMNLPDSKKMNPIKLEDRLGRVFTPVSLIQEIYAHLTPYLKPHMKVYEPGVGDHRFFKHYPLPCTYEGSEIEPIGPNPSKTSKPVKKLSVFEGDFFDQPLQEYDLILGNPPFRIETTGPSSSPIPTKPKQKTIWPDIVSRCFKHLKPNGLMAMVLPCIWLKPDKANIYELFTQHRILVLKCFSCVESNKLFGYKGQTPVCYVLVQKSPPLPTFQIWDKDAVTKDVVTKDVVDSVDAKDNGFIPFHLYPGHCIPTRRAGLLQYSRSLFKESLKPIKIATTTETKLIPSPKNGVLYTYKENQLYGIPDVSGLYHVPKVMLLHKSKPFPILDLKGKYGVGGRDKYVLLENPTKMFAFLSQPIVQEILTCFTIRMNFYEKYAFDYIPCLEESQDWLNKIKEYV